MRLQGRKEGSISLQPGSCSTVEVLAALLASLLEELPSVQTAPLPRKPDQVLPAAWGGRRRGHRLCHHTGPPVNL
jgi:hypothetical protein